MSEAPASIDLDFSLKRRRWRAAARAASARRPATPSPPKGSPVLNDTVKDEIRARGLKVARTNVGNAVTSLEMVGAMLIITALDSELKERLAVDVARPAPLSETMQMQGFSNAGGGVMVSARQ